jgi:hypothetical protein
MAMALDLLMAGRELWCGTITELAQALKPYYMLPSRQPDRAIWKARLSGLWDAPNPRRISAVLAHAERILGPNEDGPGLKVRRYRDEWKNLIEITRREA